METIRTFTILPPLLTCFFSMLLHSHPAISMTATAGAADAAVKVSTTPIFPEIPLGQARKDFQVLLRVEAPAAAAHHIPIDVVAMLDVSGSMNDRQNRPSRLDLLKAAAKFMVAKLDDGDRLSVVAFNDRPVRELSFGLMYMSGDGRRNAMNAMDKLEARGGTALLPALEEAVKILDGRSGDGRNRLGFIVLLTDGEDARGFAWRRESIHDGDVLGKYPVHAIGLGAAHDPEVLLYLAQESHGTYSFVDDDSAGELLVALSVCLGGLTTVAAVDTRVVLKAAETNGVRIDRVDAGGHGTRVGCGGAACEVDVGVLYAGEAKHFVVHLHVAAASSAVENGYFCDIDLAACDDRHQRRQRHEQHLLAVGYSYRHHPGAATITSEGHGVFVQRSPELGSGGVRHQPLLLLPSPEVLHHIVRFELLDVVAGLVDGEFAVVRDRAHASDLLQLRWEEFGACHQFWGGLDLGGLEKEVDAMASSLRAGAAAYVYAWVSSHQMQRAASLGSPEKAAAEYLTQAMRVLMEEARKLPRLAETPTTAPRATGTTVHYSGDCANLHVIDQRLELWSKVRRDVQHLMFRPSATATAEVAEGDGDDLLAAVFQEASLEAIDRAMHRDIYLAAVYASKQRRCHVGACN